MNFSLATWGQKLKQREHRATAVPPLPPPPARRPVPPPVPIPVNPLARDMEITLAALVYRVIETLAKTELYFPASDLRVLGVPDGSLALCAAVEGKAHAMLSRADIKHGERYVAHAAGMVAGLRTAERSACLIRLLCADSANSAALPLLRRVADACERVIRHSAKVLEAPSPDVFTWSNSVVTGRNEVQTAVYKALTMLSNRPALLSPAAERMARTAIWAMEIAVETVANAALECRGVVLPAPVMSVETRRDTVRTAPSSPRSAYAM